MEQEYCNKYNFLYSTNEIHSKERAKMGALYFDNTTFLAHKQSWFIVVSLLVNEKCSTARAPGFTPGFFVRSVLLIFLVPEISLTHKYITAHFPGMMQVLQ